DVEGNVGCQRVIIAERGRSHTVDRTSHLCYPFRVRVLRGERRGGRLDREANLREFREQIERELPLEHPPKHIGVEQIPAMLRLDVRALPRPSTEQTFGSEHLDRFTQRRAARAKTLAELCLDREPSGFPVRSRDDRNAELFDDSIREVLR